MKNDGEGCFVFILLIAVMVLWFAFTFGVAESNLPDWVKFALLSR